MYQNIKQEIANEVPPQRRNTFVQVLKASVFAVSSIGVVMPSTALATIQGVTFIDGNNNGVKDQGEPSLTANLFLRDNDRADKGEYGFYTTETDANGNYSFIIHNTGSFTLWSSMPWEWVQTTPVRGEGIAFYDLTITNSDQILTVDFGFIDPSTSDFPIEDIITTQDEPILVVPNIDVIEGEVITPRTDNDDNADLTLVIDETSTMAGENLMIANALEDFLGTHFDATLTIELITFQDDVTSRIVTQNIGEIIGHLRSLQLSYGGDCPNASVAALEKALPYLNQNSQIVLATAASPHNIDTTHVIAQSQKKSIKINVLLTGTCDDLAAEKAHYKNIADATGGTFQWLPRGITSPKESEAMISTVVIDAIMEIIPKNHVNKDGDKTDSLPPICLRMQNKAMDIHPDTLMLYATASDDTLYSKLYKQDDPEWVLVGNTGFKEITSLSFDDKGILWGWAKNAGLVQLDIERATATMIFPTKVELKDMRFNLTGSILYGLVGTDLWRYEPTTHAVAKLCDNLPIETEIVEVLPETGESLIRLGIHKNDTLSLHAFDVNTCHYDDAEELTAICLP
jgi:hypothetical protein